MGLYPAEGFCSPLPGPAVPDVAESARALCLGGPGACRLKRRPRLSPAASALSYHIRRKRESGKSPSALRRGRQGGEKNLKSALHFALQWFTMEPSPLEKEAAARRDGPPKHGQRVNFLPDNPPSRGPRRKSPVFAPPGLVEFSIKM